MRIIADRAGCEGHGMCEAMAHEEGPERLRPWRRA